MKTQVKDKRYTKEEKEGDEGKRDLESISTKDEIDLNRCN